MNPWVKSTALLLFIAVVLLVGIDGVKWLLVTYPGTMRVVWFVSITALLVSVVRHTVFSDE